MGGSLGWRVRGWEGRIVSRPRSFTYCIGPGGCGKTRVKDFKKPLSSATQMRKSLLQLFTTEGQMCDDHALLLDLVPWFALQDMADDECLMDLHLQLELHMTRLPDACALWFCGKSIRIRCAGCRTVGYCDIPCRDWHWPEHRLECSGLCEASGIPASDSDSVLSIPPPSSDHEV